MLERWSNAYESRALTQYSKLYTLNAWCLSVELLSDFLVCLPSLHYSSTPTLLGFL